MDELPLDPMGMRFFADLGYTPKDGVDANAVKANPNGAAVVIDQLVAAWNRRAPAEVPQEVVEMYRRCHAESHDMSESVIYRTVAEGWLSGIRAAVRAILGPEALKKMEDRL